MSFKGKAIYNPSGKAGEYSYWACNFYNGCSNGCTYCYCKKGRSAKIFGGDTPTLKKSFRDDDHALEVFEKELKQNLSELQKHGLFFSFTTDPLLPQTMSLTFQAVNIANANNVPVKVLTKRADMALWGFAGTGLIARGMRNNKELIAIGFTLTGHDDLEPGASINVERIRAMWQLHEAGFKTFASIEPIIDLDKSYDMILQTLDYCDLYKIGLLGGAKYNRKKLLDFVYDVILLACHDFERKVYFKDSLLKLAGIDRATLPANCIGRNYNIFKNE